MSLTWENQREIHMHVENLGNLACIYILGLCELLFMAYTLPDNIWIHIYSDSFLYLR